MTVQRLEPTSLVHDVAERAGLDHETAAHVVHTTLAVLGRRIPRVDAEAVAKRLPQDLGTALLEQPHVEGCEPVDVSDWPSATDDPAPRTVIRLLAERLDEQARAHLRMVDLRHLLT